MISLLTTEQAHLLLLKASAADSAVKVAKTAKTVAYAALFAAKDNAVLETAYDDACDAYNAACDAYNAACDACDAYNAACDAYNAACDAAIKLNEYYHNI